MDVDELGVGGDTGEERNAQRVPGLTVDPAQAGGVDARPVPVAVDERALEPPAQILDRTGLDVGGRQAVAVPLAVLGLELEDPVEDWSPGAVHAGGSRQGAEQGGRPRTRRGDDEYRTLDHRRSFAFDSAPTRVIQSSRVREGPGGPLMGRTPGKNPLRLPLPFAVMVACVIAGFLALDHFATADEQLL